MTNGNSVYKRGVGVNTDITREHGEVVELCANEREFLSDSVRLKFAVADERRARHYLVRGDPFGIDYSNSTQFLEVGYGGALGQLRATLSSRKPIVPKQLPQWQKMILDELAQHGQSVNPEAIGKLRTADNDPIAERGGSIAGVSPEKVSPLMLQWLKEFTAACHRLLLNFHALFCAQLGGDLLYKYEKVRPFAAGSGCLGRLLINSLPMLTGDTPLMVFRLQDREVFSKARNDIRAIQKFLAGKITEKVYCKCGKLATRTGGTAVRTTYCCNTSKEEFPRRWDALRNAGLLAGY